MQPKLQEFRWLEAAPAESNRFNQIRGDHMPIQGKQFALASVLAAFSLFSVGIPSYVSMEQLPMQDNSVVPPGGEAKMCIGFDIEQSAWGSNWGYCPANHALFGVDDPAGASGPAEKIIATMSCCPLPATDILTEEHVSSFDECPSGYVATGTKAYGERTNLTFEMRCTKVNDHRYQLADPKPAKYWGDGAAGWQGSGRIQWENIPAGMRFAHGRIAQDKWDGDGCVGYPWGSMLTKKESKYCGGMHFSQLQFKGAQGDPSKGTPVRMFADCDEVSNIEDPRSASCLKDNVITTARAY